MIEAISEKYSSVLIKCSNAPLYLEKTDEMKRTETTTGLSVCVCVCVCVYSSRYLRNLKFAKHALIIWNCRDSGITKETESVKPHILLYLPFLLIN